MSPIINRNYVVTQQERLHESVIKIYKTPILNTVEVYGR